MSGTGSSFLFGYSIRSATIGSIERRASCGYQRGHRGGQREHRAA